MSARLKCTARMGVGGGTPIRRRFACMTASPRKRTVIFYPLKVDQYEKDDDCDDEGVDDCGECGDSFILNEPRIKKFDKQDDDIDIYHPKCYVQTWYYSFFKFPESTKNLHNFDTLTANNQLIIKKILFPEIKLNKYQLQLPIDCLNISESKLKIILKERDLKLFIQKTPYDEPIWNREKALKCLKVFTETEQYKQKQQDLINGYCKKEYENKCKNNIPLALLHMVLRYCESF